MNDIITYICDFLNDTDKISLLSMSTSAHLLKNKVYFNGQILISKITHLWYFDRFTNIMVLEIHFFPKFIANLTFGDDFNQPIRNSIPESVIMSSNPSGSTNMFIPERVTHLTFGDYFNQPIKDSIPESVTHLTFGMYFNQPIKYSIPKRVTHLTFGWRFNQPINDIISGSVIRPGITHLTFGWHFDQQIKDCIPTSVTHLTFGGGFNHPIKDSIPESVTHLTFGYWFDQPIKDIIPESVTHLILSKDYSGDINPEMIKKYKICFV